MKNTLFLVFFFVAGIVLGGLFLQGCGEEQLCRNDRQCEEGMVCEPDGCRRSCDDSQDCGFGQECTDRRVEDGKICGRPS